MPLSSTNRPPRRRALAVALTSALCLSLTAWTATAVADDESVLATTPSGVDILETPETTETCAAPQVVPAFASIGDFREYVLAPGGSFEDKHLDGWQVTKSRQDGDHSGLRIGSMRKDDNKHSLKIPAGGSAVSPAMCVDLHYPTLRFMAKAEKGKGQLDVEVVYPDSENPAFHDAGSIAADGKAWGATADVPVYPERGGVTPGMRRVALRFTSVAGDTEAAEWRIDDLYVDPKRL
jgi:hypothetical protein